MFGGGFFGGGFPEMPSRPKKSNSTRYYELLAVSQDATPDELKKAHRKLALKLHPDKGGDPDKFKEINEAYDVLKDPEKRRIYDEYGEDAIKEGMSGGPGGGGGLDIFDLFMGGGGRGRGPRERRSEDVIHKLNVTLEDLYKGATKKLQMSRSLACDSCSGAGTKSGKKYECNTCRGTGIQVQIRPLGPGMVQQIQARCSNCSGTGYSTPPSDKCTACHGKCIVSGKQTFEVQIESGMRNGARIVLRGEAGISEPGLQPGDVILVVNEKPHDVFKRINIDLVIEKKISLAEALTGVEFVINHLDGRTLHVKTPEGAVIKPDTYHKIQEEGMPIHGRPYSKGNLYVHFAVVFPDTLSPQECAALKQVLPSGSKENGSIMIDENTEEVTLNSVADIEAELKSRARLGKVDEDSDDDEDGPRGQRVQCAQQ